MPALDLLIRNLGVPVANRRLLEQALVHASFINEDPLREPDLDHNERLEFLGDSVVNLVAAALLYGRFPSASEGELTMLRTSLIRRETLASIARQLDLGRFIRLGRGEDRSGGRTRDSILADTLEAVVGAIYLDSGIEPARAMLAPLFDAQIVVLRSRPSADFKTQLQHAAQHGRNITPRYRTVSAEGPDHRKIYTVEVWIGDELFGSGSGHTIQLASQQAAELALTRLAAS